MTRAAQSTRRLHPQDHPWHPRYVVWELTLACDHTCGHCGSRAGRARPDELTLPEALQVVAQLQAAGTRDVVLIGGEAYLYTGFLEIVAALREAGIRPLMTSGGRGLKPPRCRDLKEAGIALVSISVDGLSQAHNAIRESPTSYRDATRALTNLRDAGIPAAANTNVNRRNLHDLEALYEVLRSFDITAWQVQLTAPLGRAADHEGFILQPFDLLDLLPRLDALKRRAFEDGILLMPGNNLGYFGPEEALLRSQHPDGRDHWMGCQAGRFVLGIESDGAVKGCPSLQTDAYVGGNLRQQPLQEIWDHAPHLAFARARTRDDLWGYCKTCDFADVCLGGCTFTAHALLGRPGNNPYCHLRARELAARGLRERLVRAQPAPGRPFDNGRFDLVVEPLNPSS